MNFTNVLSKSYVTKGKIFNTPLPTSFERVWSLEKNNEMRVYLSSTSKYGVSNCLIFYVIMSSVLYRYAVFVLY